MNRQRSDSGTLPSCRGLLTGSRTGALTRLRLAMCVAALAALVPGSATRAAEPWVTTWAATPAPR